MSRSIELVVHDGESIGSAVRRFKEKFHEAESSATATPAESRFQELVEAKYTRGLTSTESMEMARLESGFLDSDESFYAPIIERVKAQKATAGKRSAR